MEDGEVLRLLLSERSWPFVPCFAVAQPASRLQHEKDLEHEPFSSNEDPKSYWMLVRSLSHGAAPFDATDATTIHAAAEDYADLRARIDLMTKSAPSNKVR